MEEREGEGASPEIISRSCGSAALQMAGRAPPREDSTEHALIFEINQHRLQASDATIQRGKLFRVSVTYRCAPNHVGCNDTGNQWGESESAMA
jgi:hypothetical protein